MWIRNEARPTQYGDTLFRSALEAKVAKELDDLTVQWKYEVPAHEAMAWMLGAYAADPQVVNWYLPDFTILEAPPYLQLPFWLEVKPAELLYAVRDHVECPEHFDGTFSVKITATDLQKVQLTEIHKPKALAELYDHEVLVVSAINRNRTLSALLTRDGIELSKSHPAVNHRQLLLNQERERNYALRQAEWEAREAERQEQWRERRQEIIEQVRAYGRPARYPGRCVVCQTFQDGDNLLIFKAVERWMAVCRSHLT